MKARPIAGFLVLAAGVALLFWRLGQQPPRSAPDEAPAMAEATPPSRPAIPAVLGQSCRIEATVAGGPVARAIVQSRRAQLDVDGEIDPDGQHFVAELPEQGSMWIVAIAADGRTATLEGECGGDGLLRVQLVLPTADSNAGTLKGRCYYLETGAPVPNAVIRAGIDAQGDGLAAVRSAIADSEGQYLLALPAGSWQVRCAKDSDEGVLRAVEIDARLTNVVDLYVEGRAGVAGVVLEAGHPVPRVLVRARSARQGVEPNPVTGESDAEGRFLLSGLPPGAVLVEAQAGGKFAEGHALAKVALPYAEVRLELSDSANRIEGLVLGPDEAPVEDAQLTAVALERGLDLSRSAATGPGGEFDLGGLIPGRYRLELRAVGYQASESQLTVQGVAHTELHLQKACEAKLRVLPAQPERPVRIVIKSSEKAPGGPLELAGLTGEVLAVTGLTGQVQITARTVGSVVRTATRTLDLCQAGAITELSLEDRAGTGTIEVTVLDPARKPVPGAEVWRAGSGLVRTDNRGQVRFEGLAPDTYLIGARDVRPVHVPVKAGETAQIELEVDRKEGDVRGTVSAQGAPVEGARVLATCADSGRTDGLEEASVVARSEADGSFSFVPESGSVCRVRAEHPSKGRSRAATLRAGGDPGRFELLNGGSVSGRVISAETQAPVAPCSVSLASLGGASEVEGRTVYVGNADGRFRIDDVAPGQIALSVVGEKGRGRVELTLAPGEHKDGVELEVFSRGRVVGRVLDQDRAPISAAQVAVRAGSRTLGKGVTGPDGRFDLEANAGEPLQVYASHKTHYPRGTLPFDLLPGPPTDVGELLLESRGPPEDKEGGIGLVFAGEDHGIRVLKFIADSPAREAGMEVGDLITAINGTPFGREPMVNWLVNLRGKAGTPVTLEIERGTQAPFQVTVLRRAVGLPPMPEVAD